MNHTSPVGTGGGPGPDLGLDPGTGNVRGIKEDIGEELVVGKTIEIGIGMRGRGIRTGRIEAGPTERAVRAGTEEGPEASTVPWRNGWASDSPSCFIYAAPFKQSRSRNSVFMGKSSLQLPFAFTPDASVWNTLSDRPSFFFLRSISRSCCPCKLNLSFGSFSRPDLSTLLRYALAGSVHHGHYFILSYHISLLLCLSASPSLCLCYLVSSLQCLFQCLISLSRL